MPAWIAVVTPSGIRRSGDACLAELPVTASNQDVGLRIEPQLLG